MNTYKVKYKSLTDNFEREVEAVSIRQAVKEAAALIDDESAIVSIALSKTSTGRPRSLDNFVLKEAAELVVRDQYATVNYLCRHLGIGNARANRIMDRLEEKGIVGPFRGSKPREVYSKRVEGAMHLLNRIK